MAMRGVSEDLVMARFDDLTKPWRETEAQMARAKALSDEEAIRAATNWLKECYELNMNASGLRGDR